MEEHKMGKAVNKLRRVGGSFMLVIPMNWVKAHELENGDSMEIFFDEILTKRSETHNGLNKLESQIEEITKRLGEKAPRGEGGEGIFDDC